MGASHQKGCPQVNTSLAGSQCWKGARPAAGGSGGEELLPAQLSCKSYEAQKQPAQQVMSTGTLVTLISWQSLNPSDWTCGQLDRRVLMPGTVNLAKNTCLENV